MDLESILSPFQLGNSEIVEGNLSKHWRIIIFLFSFNFLFVLKFNILNYHHP
ncbi:hypothetical protein Ataiwa_08770 [Algoriphagus taiwanensis]|uniref:Uncharacterized protein n=1 Tax=Algoriphagus taiwanensis TaxID=1445656 RepID=A0ABQ6PZ98_9BACT|nr:hypothetical protein Ataiwa_08770 [Algoriphagus taiwanensis]